jgi:large-conductance mechanosensitive channel
VAFFYSVRATEKQMRDSGLTEVGTLPQTLWLSFMPAYMVEGTKSDISECPVATDEEVQRALTHGQLEGDGELSPRWMHAQDGSGGAPRVRRRVRKDEEDDDEVEEEMSVFDAMRREAHIESAGRALQPLRWGMLAVATLIWAAMAVVVTLFWNDLQWPSAFNWDVRANSQFWGNVKALPIALVFMASDMGSALDQGIAVPDPAQEARKKQRTWYQRWCGHDDTFLPAHTPKFRPATSNDIFHRFGDEMLSVLLALTIYNVVFWAPILILDAALIHTVKLEEMATINSIATAVIIFLIIHIGRAVAARQERLANEKEAAKHSGNITDADTLRQPFLQDAVGDDDAVGAP